MKTIDYKQNYGVYKGVVYTYKTAGDCKHCDFYKNSLGACKLGKPKCTLDIKDEETHKKVSRQVIWQRFCMEELTEKISILTKLKIKLYLLPKDIVMHVCIGMAMQLIVSMLIAVFVNTMSAIPIAMVVCGAAELFNEIVIDNRGEENLMLATLISIILTASITSFIL
jgi:hypothetical protein